MAAEPKIIPLTVIKCKNKLWVEKYHKYFECGARLVELYEGEGQIKCWRRNCRHLNKFEVKRSKSA